jgi:hypothetical protein
LGKVFLLLLVATLPCRAPAAGSRDAFDVLLDEAELQFDPPAGYVEAQLRPNSVLLYERALRSRDGQLEIRYLVRPLSRLQIDYEDPHGATPDPNHLFPLVFEAMATRLSAGRHTPTREYPAEQARARFNADWAAAAVFDVAADFAADYQQGLMVALHRNRVSDAYMVFLFNEYATVKARIERGMRSLIFTPSS